MSAQHSQMAAESAAGANVGKTKRLVLFAGPHKSASSSVQEFFMQHASNRRKKHPLLANWTWPFNPRVRSFLPRKGFAPLIVEHDNIELRDTIYTRLQDAWNAEDVEGVVFGSEEFDRFGSCPWSHRNATRVVQEVLDRLQPRSFTIVVNYRLPRYEQWISIWKQLTRTKPIPYREYLCKNDIRTWEYLDAVANPLGLAHEFRSHGWTVRLIDMSGVANAQLDVANVIACEVLDVGCNGGWLVDIEQRILQNKKSGDPELSPSQLQEIERMLLQRDCTYRHTLDDDPGFDVLHRQDIWSLCDKLESEDATRDTSVLLEQLRKQVRCNYDSRSSAGGRTAHDQAGSTGDIYRAEPSSVRKVTGLHGPSYGRTRQALSPFARQDSLNTDIHDDGAHLLSVAKFQHVVLIGALVFMLTLYMRKLRRRQPRQHRYIATHNYTAATTIR